MKTLNTKWPKKMCTLFTHIFHVKCVYFFWATLYVLSRYLLNTKGTQ